MNGRAAVLQAIAVLLKATADHTLLLPRSLTDAVHLSLVVVHYSRLFLKGAGALSILPASPDVDHRFDPLLIPQTLMQFPVVVTPVGAQHLTSL